MTREGGQGHRHERLQQLLEEELSSLVRDEVQDPRLEDVRVTKVELSVDYRSARVRWVAPDESRPAIDKVERAFERASAFLRRRLGEALDLKRVPTLSFVYDRDAAAAARAATVIDDKKPE